jgi:NADH:ubiquinone oxidoreductase subunit 4 (subunit M)
LLSGLGILVTVWYTLRAVHLGFFGDARFLGSEHAAPDPSTAPILHSTAPMPPVTWPEKVAAVGLIAILVVVGVYPSLLLDMIDNSVKLMLPALTGEVQR